MFLTAGSFQSEGDNLFIPKLFMTAVFYILLTLVGERDRIIQNHQFLILF